MARWLRAASSGGFFSRWSWLLTLPFAVTLMGGYDQAHTDAERVVGVAIASGVHLLLGGVGLLAAAAERAASSRRARVGVVIVTLTVIAIGRPVALAAAASHLHVELFAGGLAGRILTNALVDTLALSVVAMVTVSMRAHRSAAERLRIVLRALERQRARDVADLSELCATVLRSTRAAVVGALPPAASRPSDPEEGALLLQRFADEVVRPTSHRLFDQSSWRSDSAAVEDMDPFPAAESPVSAGTVREHGELLRALRPRTVWLTAVGYAVIWAPYLSATMPWPLGAAVVAVAVLLGATGNRLTGLALRDRTGTAVRVGTLMVCGAATGAGIGAVVGALVACVGDQPFGRGLFVTVVLGMVIYPVLALLASVAEAGFDRAAAVEAEVAGAVDAAHAATVSVHNKLVVARRRVAQVLHSDVQAQCAAAARSLRRTGTLTEADWLLILSRIERSLERQWDAPGTRHARQTIEDTLAAWRYCMDITVEVSEAAWARLDADAARLELAVDVVSEGLTNTVRHGDDLRAHIRIDVAAASSGLIIDVISPGRITRSSGGGRADGQGVAQLRARSRRLALLASATDVTLRVELA